MIRILAVLAICAFILSGVAMGQTNKNSVFLSDSGQSRHWGRLLQPLEMAYVFSDSGTIYKMIVGRDTIHSAAPYQDMARLALLQSYAEYEKECYADSTLTKVVLHREPTFTGFMAWLKKRVK